MWLEQSAGMVLKEQTGERDSLVSDFRFYGNCHRHPPKDLKKKKETWLYFCFEKYYYGYYTKEGLGEGRVETKRIIKSCIEIVWEGGMALA